MTFELKGRSDLLITHESVPNDAVFCGQRLTKDFVLAIGEDDDGEPEFFAGC